MIIISCAGTVLCISGVQVLSYSLHWKNEKMKLGLFFITKEKMQRLYYSICFKAKSDINVNIV